MKKVIIAVLVLGGVIAAAVATKKRHIDEYGY